MIAAPLLPVAFKMTAPHRTATRQGIVDDGSRAAPGTILRARSGQFRHVITVPAELEAMPLKQLHKSCWVVVEGGKARLERMQQ
jgi:hypothetical protein